jgi:alpha-glucosidase
LKRDYWNWRTRRNPTGIPSPGKLQHVEEQPYGGRFHFSHCMLEVRFLALDVVRVTWEPSGPLLPYISSDPFDETPEVACFQEEDWVLQSDTLRVTVSSQGELSYFTREGRLLRREHPPKGLGGAWSQCMELDPQACVYGLGERAGGFNLRGGRYRLWNQDPEGGYGPGVDPLYLNIPTYFVNQPQGAYLVFYENSHSAEFHFGTPAEVHFEGGPLRYDFIYGNPAKILSRYCRLTGFPALPPRWALGYHQSRWGYSSAEEVREVVKGFREHHLPLKVIHLDIDYMDGYRVFTMDDQRFAHFSELAAELAADDVCLVTIVDPGVKCDEGFSLFHQGVQRDMFCRMPNGKLLTAPVWPGWVAFPDFTRPEVRRWWGDQYDDFVAAGVAGFWHDMNEPSAFAAWGELTLPRGTRHGMEGRGGDHLEAHNLYGWLMNRAAYEALRRIAPQRRPWLLSRSGWAGNQRYTWTWTGDIDSTWECLRQTIPTILGLGLSGIPFTGPDIGGFTGAPSAELYLRWFQLATFLPFFRTHSAADTPRREPWVYGESYTGIIRRFLHLRQQLMPYLYTLAWETSCTGVPLIRPLFWAQPEAQHLWEVDDAFLLGDELLVAPILHPDIKHRSLTLPSGVWFNLWTDDIYPGDETVSLPADLETIPVLVRGGSLLPMTIDGELHLHLYLPPDGSGEYTYSLYSDAGDGYGDSRVDRFQLSFSDQEIRLLWEEEGAYPFPYSAVCVQLHGLKFMQGWLDGKPVPILEEGLRCEPFRRLVLRGQIHLS